MLQKEFNSKNEKLQKQLKDKFNEYRIALKVQE